MKNRIAMWLPLFMLFAASPAALAQVTPKSPGTKSQSAPSSATATQKKNVQAYIDLMQPIVDHWPGLAPDVLGPLHYPKHFASAKPSHG